MKGVRLDDTIAAISTGGMGAIGIVRMSGGDCIALADKIFKGKKIFLYCKKKAIPYAMAILLIIVRMILLMKF